MNDKKNTNKTNEETEKMPDGKVHPVTEADSEHSDYIREEDGTVTRIYHIRHEDPEVTKQKEQRRLKLRRKRRRLRIWTVILSVLVIFNVVVASFGLLIAKRMVEDAPTLDVTDFIGEESSKIYDDEGNLVTEVGVYLRENITYDQLPESVVDAFLSIEDSRFFTHNGFDIPRFTMAIIQNLKTRSFGQGGSTFTMQLVKNTYFTVDSMDASNTGTERTKSIEYKVQQIYLAMELEKLISKKEIFQLYRGQGHQGDHADQEYQGIHAALPQPEHLQQAGNQFAQADAALRLHHGAGEKGRRGGYTSRVLNIALPGSRKNPHNIMLPIWQIICHMGSIFQVSIIRAIRFCCIAAYCLRYCISTGTAVLLVFRQHLFLQAPLPAVRADHIVAPEQMHRHQVPAFLRHIFIPAAAALIVSAFPLDFHGEDDACHKKHSAGRQQQQFPAGCLHGDDAGQEKEHARTCTDEPYDIFHGQQTPVGSFLVFLHSQQIFFRLFLIIRHDDLFARQKFVDTDAELAAQRQHDAGIRHGPARFP